MSEDTKSDAFTRELKSRIGNAPEPNCVTNTEVLKLIAMLRDRISTINILQACVESAEQDLASLSADDEKPVEAMEEAYAEARFNGPPEKAIRAALAVARKALTPSPTPYVRPAAEIRAEIERLEAERKDIRHTEGAKIENKARIAGLTFALTPPTQETP